MRRASILVVMAIAACGNPSERHLPDAQPVDAPVDTPSGSGNASALGGYEASPRDHDLEIGVFALSFVVAAPIGMRKRRRATPA